MAKSTKPAAEANAPAVTETPIVVVDNGAADLAEQVKNTDAGSPDVAAPDPAKASVDQAQVQQIDEALGNAVQNKANPPKKNSAKEVAAEKSGLVEEAEEVGGKKVNIVLVQDHTTIIGGNSYDFKRGHTYEVPEDVAAILTNAFIAMRK